jgi:hypothetical protein
MLADFGLLMGFWVRLCVHLNLNKRNMKSLAFVWLFIAVNVCACTNNSGAPATTTPPSSANEGGAAPAASGQTIRLAQLMVEMETTTKWTAITDDWKDRRTPWAQEVLAAGNNYALLAELLLEYAKGLTRVAFTESWGGASNAWVEAVEQANSTQTLGQAMLDLAAHFKPEHRANMWLGRQADWTTEVQTEMQ